MADFTIVEIINYKAFTCQDIKVIGWACSQLTGWSGISPIYDIFYEREGGVFLNHVSLFQIICKRQLLWQ